MLGKNFAYKNSDEIDRDFGVDFSNHFNTMQTDIWSKPIQSSFGFHIVKIVDKQEGYLPDIKDIFSQVELDYANNIKEQLLEKYIMDVKSEYNIIINPNFEIQ